MASPQSSDPIQRFAALVQTEWAKLDSRIQAGLDTEDLMDILWLAQYLPAQAEDRVTKTPQAEADPVSNQRSGNVVSPPVPSNQEKKAGVYPTSPPDGQANTQPGMGAGIPIQLPAASALRSQLDLARALRPLMRKIPSPTQRQLDENATATQIAEQGVYSPVLIPAPERWFDLALVIEDTPSLKIWQDTLEELQTLVERQGAFRQIRTWRVRSGQGRSIELSPYGQFDTSPARSCPGSTLVDPTQRRMIWLISDCTSELWDLPAIYQWIETWGKHSPLAVVQLFPERLWPRTALEIGEKIRFHSTTAGATHATISRNVAPIYPGFEDVAYSLQDASPQEKNGAKVSVNLPVVSLEPEPISRWTQVTTGVGGATVAGFRITLSELTPPASRKADADNFSAQDRVEEFCATASITAQKLAGLMASVPVNLPVVNLIQKAMLPQSRQIHVAEVLMGGLLETVQTSSGSVNLPTQYRFPEDVRLLLIDAVPISKTTQVLDLVSADISGRLGLSNRTFSALIASLPSLEPQEQESIQYFAEIGLDTLRRLGGMYRAQAEQLAQYVNPVPPDPTPQQWPLLLEHRYTMAYVELLQRFDFETATIELKRRRLFQRKEWVITTSAGYGWQRVEDLGNGVSLELVEILGGSFQMGSPKNEPERFRPEDPQHEVKLGSFLIGKYPVTQAQWRAIASLERVNQDLDPDPSRFKGDNRPVEQVSWNDAMEFCERLSRKTGRIYGLPTEAEWEYACRAGTTTPFHFGAMITTELSNYGGNAYNNGPKGSNRDETTKVGHFPANAFGLYDMHGNVWEWCADHWHESYENKPEPLKENGNLPWTSGNLDADRSLRGGSWINEPSNCRSAPRIDGSPSVGLEFNGFRVVCRRV